MNETCPTTGIGPMLSYCIDSKPAPCGIRIHAFKCSWPGNKCVNQLWAWSNSLSSRKSLFCYQAPWCIYTLFALARLHWLSATISKVTWLYGQSNGIVALKGFTVAIPESRGTILIGHQCKRKLFKSVFLLVFGNLAIKYIPVCCATIDNLQSTIQSKRFM